MTTRSLSTIMRDALIQKYKGEIASCVAELSVHFDRPTANTDNYESGSILTKMEKLLERIARAHECITTLDRVYPLPETVTTEVEDTKSKKKGS